MDAASSMVSREQLFGEILDNSFNEIYLFDAETLKFLQVNSGARDNLGYQESELLGMSPVDIKPEFTREAFQAMIAPLKAGKQPRLVFRTLHQRKDGSTYPVEIRLQLSTATQVPVFVAIALDISERQAYFDELERLALQDTMTGLPNRTLLIDRMQHAMAMAQREKETMLTMVLDPSRMREINDILGHNNGDQLLQLIARRLKGLFRAADTVARIGGDEFAIVLFGEAAIAEILVEKIRQRFYEPFKIDGTVLHIDFCIGVSVYPEHGDTAAELLRNADAALHFAKQEKVACKVFRNDDNPFTHRRLKLVGDLHTAIEQGEIEFYLQPQIELATHKIIGAEALARWHHPTEGMIPPSEFIPLAEHTGLIGSLTEHALQRVVSHSGLLMKCGVHIPIAVNLSPNNLLDRRFPSLLQQMLDKEGLSSERIALEITEAVLMQNPEICLKVLRELSGMGFDLHIDDYGTGYSSLSYLKQLPVNCLKIDQSFIRDMLKDESAAVIVSSTIDMAHNLGLKVIAEGVEDESTLQQLSRLDCDVVQGYYFSKPLPKPEFREWMEQHQCKAPQCSGAE